jgi:predicted nucleotidyltransferase
MSSSLVMLTPAAKSHLTAFKREVEEALPGQVARVTLFGSRARGDAEEDSDYDVAVFVRDGADQSDVRSAVSDVAFEHLLNGLLISAIVLPAEYVDDPELTELAWEIAQDGLVL